MLNMMIEPWHWLVFGVFLVMLELAMPTFVLLIMGVAAIVTAIFLWLFSFGFNVQISVWIALSIIFSVLWFKFLKPLQKDKTKAGLGGEAVLGEIGVVTTTPIGDKKGVVRFSVPILGTDEWPCRSMEELRMGDRVKVVKILGNELLVEKTNHQ